MKSPEHIRTGEKNVERDLHFASSQAAIAYCHQLISDGTADLFRGQTQDWPLILPSLLRGTAETRAKAGTVLEAFIEWASAVPQMGSYGGDISALTAIAQHYGIPTRFLDLTRAPEIAELFACSVSTTDTSDTAVIYCFNKKLLEQHHRLNLVEIDVANLWRLQTQHGLFLEFSDEYLSDLRDRAIRLHFPRRLTSPEDSRRLYPQRKSSLELVIDQRAYRHKINDLFSLFADIKFQARIKRYTYPGAFRWRSIPEFSEEWLNYDLGWILPVEEHITSMKQSAALIIKPPRKIEPKKFYKSLTKKFDSFIRTTAPHSRTLEFSLRLPEEHGDSEIASMLLNRCWDGIRAHPYRIESAARSLAATVVGLIQSRTQSEDETWQKQLWGAVEHMDAAPIGGHIDTGLVSKRRFEEALHVLHRENLTHYARRKVAENPLFITNYVVDPWILFDFAKFSALFVEQFVPYTGKSSWTLKMTV